MCRHYKRCGKESWEGMLSVIEQVSVLSPTGFMQFIWSHVLA